MSTDRCQRPPPQRVFRAADSEVTRLPLGTVPPSASPLPAHWGQGGLYTSPKPSPRCQSPDTATGASHAEGAPGSQVHRGCFPGVPQFPDAQVSQVPRSPWAPALLQQQSRSLGRARWVGACQCLPAGSGAQGTQLDFVSTAGRVSGFTCEVVSYDNLEAVTWVDNF